MVHHDKHSDAARSERRMKLGICHMGGQKVPACFKGGPVPADTNAGDIRADLRVIQEVLWRDCTCAFATLSFDTGESLQPPQFALGQASSFKTLELK